MKCSTCQGPAEDKLVRWGETKKVFGLTIPPSAFENKPYCRDHLIEEFQKLFEASSQKIVVFYPWLENFMRKGVYHFQVRNPNNKDFVGEALRNITGKCANCGNEANVAYFGKETIPIADNRPDYNSVSAAPNLLCKKCTFQEIKTSLRNFAGHFDPGLYAPGYEGPKGPQEGMYFTSGETNS